MELFKKLPFLSKGEYICVHFWYVWTYAKILVFFPLLAMLCKKDVDKTRIRRFLMLLSVMNLLLTEVMKFVGKSNVNLSDYTLDKYFLYVLIGYEIFLLLGKTDINIKKVRAVAIALMLAGIFGEIILNYVYFYMNGTDYTSDCTTVISSVGLFVALNTLRETRISKIWNWLGRYTLYVYMVHSAVIHICNRRWQMPIWIMCGAGESTLALLMYDVIYGLIIFMISLGVSIVFKFVYEDILLKTAKKMYVSARGVGKATNE